MQVTSGSGAAVDQVELVGVPLDDVDCDAVLLEQAISNLVQNALIARGRRSPVRVTVSVEPGSGPETLGLALVKRIVEAHGGTVACEPPAAGGASFVLRVPLRERDAGAHLLRDQTAR